MRCSQDQRMRVLGNGHGEMLQQSKIPEPAARAEMSALSALSFQGTYDLVVMTQRKRERLTSSWLGRDTPPSCYLPWPSFRVW